jgi:DNA-binding XRE family transcriptional regulator
VVAKARAVLWEPELRGGCLLSADSGDYAVRREVAFTLLPPHLPFRFHLQRSTATPGRQAGLSQPSTSIYKCVGAAATATDSRSGAWLLNQNPCNSKGLDRSSEVICMAKTSFKPRGPTAVDTHVGQKIRARRIFLRMSQTEVADAADISFQQIQKYENGTNRVGASRLQQISNALGVSPFYFLKVHQPSERRGLHRTKASYRRMKSFHFSRHVKAPL